MFYGIDSSLPQREQVKALIVGMVRVTIFTMIWGFIFANYEYVVAAMDLGEYKRLVGIGMLICIGGIMMFDNLPYKQKRKYSVEYQPSDENFERPLRMCMFGLFIISKDVVSPPLINWIMSLI